MTTCDQYAIMATLERKTSKGGYDYEFVSPPPKSLECPVCLLTLRDPHVISCCGNEFCQVCIERVQRDGKPCPLCNEPKFTTFLHKKLVREVNALTVCCPQKELGCDWEGELGQLQSHLSPGAGVVSSKGCGFVIVDCAYQCGAQLQRQLLQKHEMEICPKRPIELQVGNLMEKFEAISVEFKRVSTENQQLRQELDKVKEIHKQELCQMMQNNQLEFNQLKLELSGVKELNKEMKKLCDKLRREQVSLKTDVDKQKAMQNDFDKRFVSLQTLTIPLPVPPFYFSMPNVDHFQSNNLVYCSEPFYSHPGGYKMSVFVYPNGHDDCSGHFLSVFVGILRGEFDDQLRWPFDGGITIEMYNRTTNQWSSEDTLVVNKRACGLTFVKRCVDAYSYGHWGTTDFLSLSDFKNDFVKATNIARFRVTKVEIFNH